MHACNPPDFLLLAARSLRRTGTRFVFDHHDLVPELYRSRFGGGTGPLYRVAVALERVAFRLGRRDDRDQRVLPPDRDRARAAWHPADVFVVRNGPNLARFRPVEPDPSLRRGRAHLIAYLGIMGPQDGIDHARARRSAGSAAGATTGTRSSSARATCSSEMRALAAELGVGDRVEFAGWRYDDDIRTILSSADVCLAPDPPSPLNDVSTMIKIPEYMAMGKPIVSYALARVARLGGRGRAVCRAATIRTSLGQCLDELLDDPERCARGWARSAASGWRAELAWEHSESALLAAYARALERAPSSAPLTAASTGADSGPRRGAFSPHAGELRPPGRWGV